MRPNERPDDEGASTDATASAGVDPIGVVLSERWRGVFAPDTVLADRYRVVRFIARGGMGEVYEVEDLELGTRVALKTLRGDRTEDAVALDRLKREVLHARKVNHPNVCRVFDVAYHRQSTGVLPVLTMELIDGENLDGWCRRRGPVSPADALPIVRQICAALTAAHAGGVVHRDFKGQNVLLAAGNGEIPRVVVTDFGLARTAGDPTQTVDLAGTPAYMPPEQLLRNAPITPASDLYALGVVLHQMITGSLPSFGVTGSASMSSRQRSATGVTSLRSATANRRWADAVEACLQIDPGQRPASAAAVLAMLEGRWSARRRRMTVGIALFGATGIALAWGSADPCPPAGDPLFVDAAAEGPANGSEACPFRTITDAVAAAGGEPRTIRIAVGRYDATTGERFPLVLSSGQQLIGAGRDATEIVGTGRWKPPGGSSFTDDEYATIGVDAAAGGVVVRGVALRSGSLPQQLVNGISCSAGHLDSFAAKVDSWDLEVEDAILGPGYDAGILVAGSVRDRLYGCATRVTDSTFTGSSLGMWLVGCGKGGPEAPTAAAVERTSFQSIRSASGNGTGIRVWDCAIELVVSDSDFSDTDVGIYGINHDRPLTRTVIEDSSFYGMTRNGIVFDRGFGVERLENNLFWEIAAPGGKPASAIEFLGDPRTPSNYARVVEARRNRFLYNDVAIRFGGELMPPGALLDFGTTDDPGENHFICSARRIEAGVGGDVIISAVQAAGATVQLAGNAWDHDPPIRAGADATNGADVIVTSGAPPIVEVGGAGLVEERCPSGIR